MYRWILQLLFDERATNLNIYHLDMFVEGSKLWFDLLSTQYLELPFGTNFRRFWEKAPFPEHKRLLILGPSHRHFSKSIGGNHIVTALFVLKILKDKIWIDLKKIWLKERWSNEFQWWCMLTSRWAPPLPLHSLFQQVCQYEFCQRCNCSCSANLPVEGLAQDHRFVEFH